MRSFQTCWVALVAAGASLSGCGSSDDFGATDAENVGRVSQATLALDRYDLPPAAAAVARVVDGHTEIWVFACGSDHRMRRRTQGSDGTWTDWADVANNFKCYSGPTIAKWIGGTPRETIGVYYRGGNSALSPDVQDRLIEVWYDSDTTKSITDLSYQSNFGSIKGTPAVVDAVDTTGLSKRISVLVKRPNDELYTFDLYQGSWHVQAVKGSNGNTATAPYASYFGVTYGQYTNNYFSVQTRESQFSTFTRSSWSTGYRWSEGLTDSEFEGVLTFGRPDPSCVQKGCWMTHRYHDYKMLWGGLQATTLGESPKSYFVFGSTYSAPTGDNTNAVFREFVRLQTINYVDGTVRSLPQYPSASSAGSLVLHGASSGRTAAFLYTAHHDDEPTNTRRLIWMRISNIGIVAPEDMNYPGHLMETER